MTDVPSCQATYVYFYVLYSGSDISLEKTPEHARSTRVLELSQCLGLNLSNTFARHGELLTDLLKCVIAGDPDAKAHADDAFFAWRQRGKSA